ncbi:hypothetical protein A2U01_0008780 [Trifolium medium]|uniref:Uncharacterized protein n=1 Tax=Trifolium medium TaxID=97028 RepID=A0A392MLQ4_9FABA|nr:hypothetical protein [Trifolium medium]
MTGTDREEEENPSNRVYLPIDGGKDEDVLIGIRRRSRIAKLIANSELERNRSSVEVRDCRDVCWFAGSWNPTGGEVL